MYSHLIADTPLPGATLVISRKRDYPRALERSGMTAGAYAGLLRGVAFNVKLPLAIVSSNVSWVAESSR